MTRGRSIMYPVYALLIMYYPGVYAYRLLLQLRIYRGGFFGWLLVPDPNCNTREAGDLQRAVLSIRELKRDQRERNKQIENGCVC